MGQPNSIGVRDDVTLGALAGLIKTPPPMTSHPIFCDGRLAERIESAETQLIAEASHAAHRRAPGGDGFLLPIAGGAGLRIAGDIAQLAGTATAPEHRRQGIHTALMKQRLSDAAAAGSD